MMEVSSNDEFSKISNFIYSIIELFKVFDIFNLLSIKFPSQKKPLMEI